MALTLSTSLGSSSPTRRLWPSSAPVRGLLGLAIFVVILEVAPRIGLIDRAFFPPFSEMMKALWTELQAAAFWTALGQTMKGWAIGFGIALIGGIVVGVLIGSVAILRDITSSTIEFLRPIPSVALIPLAVLMFGTEMRATLLLVIYASFWQVLVQVLSGVQDVDPVAQETARTYRFRRITVIRTVIWPTALPYVMTGFRLAASVALVLEITGELIIGTPGLGSRIGLAQSTGLVPRMFALVIVAGIIGVLLNVVARAAEKRVLRWHPSVRRDAS